MSRKDRNGRRLESLLSYILDGVLDGVGAQDIQRALGSLLRGIQAWL